MNNLAFSYDENREIDLIHGIQKKGLSFQKLEDILKQWSHSKNISIPKLKLIETTPSLSQGYYVNNTITIKYSENHSFKDLKVTLAHELAHHYFKIKNKQFKTNKKEEIQADLFSLEFVSKQDILNKFKKHIFKQGTKSHPSIDERSSKIIQH